MIFDQKTLQHILFSTSKTKSKLSQEHVYFAKIRLTKTNQNVQFHILRAHVVAVSNLHDMHMQSF